MRPHSRLLPPPLWLPTPMWLPTASCKSLASKNWNFPSFITLTNQIRLRHVSANAPPIFFHAGGESRKWRNSKARDSKDSVWTWLLGPPELFCFSPCCYVNIAPSGPNAVSSVVTSCGRKPVTLGTIGQSSVLASSIPGSIQPLITALQTLTKNQQSSQVTKSVKSFNVNVKLINPDKKSMYATYVLREVGSFNISTPLQLRQQILKQFGDKLVSSKLDFPVGYMKAGSKLWIHSDDDI